MILHHKGFMLLRTALTVLAGGGSVLGGSYLVSKLKDRQEMEGRLDRIEELLAQLTEMEAKPAAKKAPARRAAKPKVKSPESPEAK